MPIWKKTLFFESEGDFCDNSWALYQYLKQNRCYKYIWIVSDVRKFKNTKDTKFVSFKQTPLAFYSAYARSKYIFYTHCMLDTYIKRKGQCVVDLEHGCGFKAGKNSTGNYCDIALVTGSFAKKAFSIYLGCDENKVKPLGYPRNDILVNNIGAGIDNPLSGAFKYNKLILWMPTFRDSSNKGLSEKMMNYETGLPLISNDKDLDGLNSFLSKRNCLFMIKIHHLQADKPAFHKKYSNIQIVTDSLIATKGLQLYQIIGYTDALLTDYSSISIDYILLNKPMAYILDDYDMYNKCRGFKYDNVKDLMPGHHIYTVSDLYNFICDVETDYDKFKNERNRLVSFFHDVKYGQNCETLVNYLGI